MDRSTGVIVSCFIAARYCSPEWPVQSRTDKHTSGALRAFGPITPLAVAVVGYFLLGSIADPRSLEPLVLTVNATLVVCLFAALGELAVIRPNLRKGIIWGTLGVVVLSIGCQLASLPDRLPNGVITILREQQLENHLSQLYGLGDHAGWNFSTLKNLLGDPSRPRLKAIVGFNLWLTGCTFVALTVIIRSWVGKRWLAVLVVMGFWASPATRNAAFSELPSALLWMYVIAGVVFWVRLRSTDSGRIRWMSSLGLVAACVLTMGTRLEVGVAGLAALLAHAMVIWSSRGHFDVYRRRLGLLMRQPRSVTYAVVAVLGITFAVSQLHWLDLGHMHWLINGLNLFSPATLTFPTFVGSILSFGVLLLLLCGFYELLRQPLRAALLPLAVIVLYRIHYTAGSHDFTRMFRYSTMYTPLLAILAAGGARAWLRWTNPGGALFDRRILVNVGLALAFFAFPISDLSKFSYGDPSAGDRPWWNYVLVSRDVQLEMRFLLDTLDDAPECVFVARTIEAGTFKGRGEPRWQYSLYGAGVPYRAEPAEGRSINELAPESACLRYYYGSDCNRVGLDGCEQDIEGLSAVVELSVFAKQYNHPLQFGALYKPLNLGVYSIREAE